VRAPHTASRRHLDADTTRPHCCYAIAHTVTNKSFLKTVTQTHGDSSISHTVTTSHSFDLGNGGIFYMSAKVTECARAARRDAHLDIQRR